MKNGTRYYKIGTFKTYYYISTQQLRQGFNDNDWSGISLIEGI